MKFFALVALLASFANAESDDDAGMGRLGMDLKNLIQSRLSAEQRAVSSVRAIDCSAGQSLFCPASNVPDVTFPSTGGVVVGSVPNCCPGSYLQCQIQQNAQYCREIAEYTITPAEGNSEDICPPTSPECSCQTSLSGEKFLRLNFCPTPATCCPTCECHGDPHCTSFNGDVGVWATCDDRDATCLHKQSTCAQTTYDGQACQWKMFGAIGYCVRNPASKVPSMVMYRKTYKNYFNPGDNTEYEFVLTLSLGTYGAISTIRVEDAGQVYVFGFTPDQKCKANAAYPLNSQGKVFVNNLPSGVRLAFQCYDDANYARAPTMVRWEVNAVRDPWYQPEHPVEEIFGGFCATGKISESAGNAAIGGCQIMDRQVANYLLTLGSQYNGCKDNQNIDVCKSQWCNNNYKKLDLGAASDAQKKAACNAFVKDKKNTNNFVVALCASSPKVSGGVLPADPRKCDEDDDCRSCVDNVQDYPEEMGNFLNGANGKATLAPTTNCQVDLVAQGLSRKTLATFQSGIQIDFFNTNSNSWAGVFALLDDEIAACGGCKNSIYVNGSVPANNVLMEPGKYRVKQCNGLDTDPKQDLCPAALAYNASVWYANPMDGVAVSTPLGVLFKEGDLVCSRTKYPACPPDYSCCNWDITTQKMAWQACMISKYGADYASKYPKCGK